MWLIIVLVKLNLTAGLLVQISGDRLKTFKN